MGLHWFVEILARKLAPNYKRQPKPDKFEGTLLKRGNPPYQKDYLPPFLYVKYDEAHMGASTESGMKLKILSGDRIMFIPVNAITTYAGKENSSVNPK